ncbi:hypothetical protein HYPSUDRAFT_47231 [Hypholoma sublateritium FD-334 SS-4]|uniref:F-box domain-containing protein n=1 Tax=Hypholoma sublateritium (strain FD-334 SS-4) TaxID=945553 RepID=A0A0D2NBV2_HYPSF|nr:hypothetical protein HYPSUDRAFT_47231 [Hypholoma sublateritium FD-334 SS-4]
MNGVYGQLSFITGDPHVLSQKLVTLSNDVQMCERVRVLTIWPSAVRDAIKATTLEKPLVEDDLGGTPPPRPRSYLNKIGGMLGHTRSLSRPSTPSPSLDPVLSPTQRMDSFLAVVKSLRNVDELEVNWYLDHGSRTSAWKVSFFPEIWQGIGYQLRRLTLDVKLFKLNDIVKSCGALPRVQELYLSLRCDAAHPQPGGTAVPYFINKLSATLETLSIRTIGHQVLAADFQLLTHFPRLRALSLVMPLDAQHFPDPSGLAQLLRNHPRISDLCLRYSRCCSDPADDGFHTAGGAHRVYGAISMPALRALELGLHLPIPPSAATRSTLHAIARMAQNITSLTLVDRSLALGEVSALLRLFHSRRLRRLSLFARALSPQLVDVVARACPDLSALALDVQAVVTSETPDADDTGDFSQALFEWAVDLDSDRWRYGAWALADVAVMKWEFKVGHAYDWAAMQALALVVPAIRSFAGMGHTREDRSLRPLGSPRRLVEIGNQMKPFSSDD